MTTEIQLPVAELKQALPGFSKIVGKTFLPALKCLRITQAPNGPAYLQATNLDDFATLTLESASSLKPVDLLVPFDDLSKIAKGCSSTDCIRIIQNDKTLRLVYPIGNNLIELGIESSDLGAWPQVPIIDQESIVVGEEFKSAIKAALDCSSEDETRTILQSAFLDVSDPKAHYIVGADGRQIFAANSFCFDLKKSMVVPHRAFLVWKGFVEDGDWKLSVQGPAKKDEPGWINIRSNRWNLITKQIDGKYPDWRNVIPKPDRKEAAMLLHPEAVELLLNVVPKLPGADQTNQSVGLLVTEDKKLVVQAEAKNGGSKVTIPIGGVTIQGKSTSIHLNRTYLLRALRLGLVDLEIYSSEHIPIVIFKSEGTRLIVAGLNMDNRPAHQSPPPQNNPPTQSASVESQEQPKEEPQTMKTINRIEQAQTTQTPQADKTQEPVPAFKQALEHLEKIKETLKSVVTDLNDLMKMLTQAQREKRATEKEIESIRDSLQSLQRIKI